MTTKYTGEKTTGVTSLQLFGKSEKVGSETVVVYLRDEDGKILLASGTTVPTATTAGYAKSALFIKSDAVGGTKGLYENQGTTSSCDFNVIGDITSAEIADGAITTPKLADAAVTPPKTKTKAEVALADADATLTAAQLIDSGLFTITPTVARTLTTDTAANLVAAMAGYQVGTWFDFTIVNLAAYDVTLAAGTGVTIKGNAVVNNASATFRVRFDSATAVTIYRL